MSSDSYESSSSSGTSSSVISWIHWYCSLPGHDLLLEVPEEFIEDEFNLTGLPSLVPLYAAALDTILDLEPETNTVIASASLIDSSAELLYGLIHARYLITKAGLSGWADKVGTCGGVCPRIGCGKCWTVPAGLSDTPGVDTVKMYCPRCGDMYHPTEVISSSFF